MFCPGCGIQITDDTKFCKSCGANLRVVREALTGRGEQFDWSKTWVAEMFLTEEEKERRRGVTPAEKRRNEIKAGVITTLAGLGVIIFFRFFFEAVANNEPGDDAEIIRRLWLIGVIPFLVGVGLLFNGIFLSKPGRIAPAPPPAPNQLPAKTTNQLAAAPATDFSVVEHTTAHLPEKRETIYQLEQTHQLKIVLLPNPYWEVPQYKITSLADEKLVSDIDNIPATYTLLADTSKETQIEEEYNQFAIPAVERFDQSIQMPEPSIGKYSFMQSVLSKLTAWGRRAKSSTRAPEKVESLTSNNKAGSTMMRSSPRARNGPRLAIDKNITPKRTVSEKSKIMDSRPVASKHKSSRYSSDSDIKHTQKTQPIPTTEAGLRKLDSKAVRSAIAPTMQSTPQKIVYRYGGEPRVQQRSY